MSRGQDSRSILLRHDEQLRADNTFRVRESVNGNRYFLEAHVRCGSARPKWVLVEVASFGRDVPNTDQRPAALTRVAEDAWRVEARQWHADLPKESLLLTQVPGGTFAAL